jgi:hypothetical protein
MVLSCEGVVVDYLDGLGGLLKYHTEFTERQEIKLEQSASPKNCSYRLQGSNLASLPDASSASKLTETISRCLTLDRGKLGLTTRAPPDGFRNKFIASCTVEPQPEPNDNKLKHFLD